MAWCDNDDDDDVSSRALWCIVLHCTVLHCSGQQTCFCVAMQGSTSSSNTAAVAAAAALSAGSDSKSQLLSKLSGSWGDIALQAAGSFFLEVCYCWSDLTHKEVIVGDVAGRQAALLSGCYWGHKLMSRLGVEAYLRR